ncbi:Penicillinase repressor [uncultured archaeon]|nr:Penicillinase repressor [uncultured archaeon]
MIDVNKKNALNMNELLEVLGPLEKEIMEIVWSRTETSTHDVLEELRKKRDIAMTTVSSTLNRLYDKNLLKRRSDKGVRGLCYYYAPLLNKEEFNNIITVKVMDKLLKDFREPMTAYLIEELAKSDPIKLQELRKKIEESLKGYEPR